MLYSVKIQTSTHELNQPIKAINVSDAHDLKLLVKHMTPVDFGNISRSSRESGKFSCAAPRFDKTRALSQPDFKPIPDSEKGERT